MHTGIAAHACWDVLRLEGIMVATSAGTKSHRADKHILSSCSWGKSSKLGLQHERFYLDWQSAHVLRQKWAFMLQLKWSNAFKSTWNVNWHETGQATLASPPCSRDRSCRLWSLLRSYGRLQRWNVRPVNTVGRKSQPIWQRAHDEPNAGLQNIGDIK